MELATTHHISVNATASYHASVIASYIDQQRHQPGRTIPGETVEQVEEEPRRIAGEAALRIIASRDLLTAQPNHPFAELVRTVADAGDYTGALFWTDDALFADAGIPTVVFGPAGEGAHATVEWVSLTSLARVREVVRRVAGAWCA